MKTFNRVLLLMMVCWLATVATVSAADVVVNEQFRSLKLQQEFSYQQSDVADPRQLTGEWQPMPTLRFGNQQQPYWLKLNLDNQSLSHRILVLRLAQAQTDEVDVWYEQDQHWQHFASGDQRPFELRNIADETHIFPLSLPSKQQLTLFIRVATQGSAAAPWQLLTEQEFIASHSQQNLLLGILLGYFAALVVSLIILRTITRQASFGHFAQYLILAVLFVAASHGITIRYLWPMFSGMQEWLLPLFANTSLIAALHFARHFYPNKHWQRLSRLMLWGIYILAANALLGYLLPYHISLYIDMLFAVCTYSTMVWLGWLQMKQQLLLARAFMLAWATIVVGVLSSAIVTVLAWTQYSHLLLLFSLMVTASVMTLVMIQRHAQQRDEQVLSQQQALADAKAQRKLQEASLQAEADLREDLEQKIQERTFELEVTLRELQEKNRELEEKNTLDSLTGVRNRSFFDKRLGMEHRRSRREQSLLSVIMLDIDHFKAVNDNYGHPAGDEVIRRVALALQMELKRPSDSVCRYGGEEFALILPNTPAGGALQVAEAVRQRIEETPVRTQAGDIQVTVSSGIFTAIADQNLDTSAFVQYADQALYSAKQQGRNRCCHSEFSQHLSED